MATGQTYTLGDIAARFALGLSPVGSSKDLSSIVVTGLATLQNASETQLSFFDNKKYRSQLRATRAAAVILRQSDAADCPVPCLVSDKPYLAYASISALFARHNTAASGVHPTALVHPEASVAPTASIGAYAVVESGAIVSADAIIGAGCVIGQNAFIGCRSRLYPRVVLYHDVRLGDDVTVHSGVVIGADGFGYAPDAGEWRKIHQLGSVVIGDRVEIGANTCIDRGALDDTVIGDGVIIDNHVQIAHNVKIGDHTAIAACTGIAGSTVIGAHCTIAGAVGIVGHLTIADGVHITAKSLVTGSINQSGSYSSGTAMQATPHWRKNAVRFLQLDTLFDRVRKMEAQIISRK